MRYAPSKTAKRKASYSSALRNDKNKRFDRFLHSVCGMPDRNVPRPSLPFFLYTQHLSHMAIGVLCVSNAIL